MRESLAALSAGAAALGDALRPIDPEGRGAAVLAAFRDAGQPYFRTPETAVQRWASWTVNADKATRRSACSLLLVDAMADSCANRRIETLPPSVAAGFVEEFRRILRMATSRQHRHESLEEDLFLKELALCQTRIFPISAVVADPREGVPRRLLWESDVAGRLRLAWLLARGKGVLAPYLGLHLHPRMLRGFRPEGWRQAYRSAAALLRADPALGGIFASAWFYDPALKAISPELDYLRTEPLSGGALIVSRPPETDDVGEALASPGARREAYAQGRYRPSGGVMIWPRSALLRWDEALPPHDDAGPRPAT